MTPYFLSAVARRRFRYIPTVSGPSIECFTERLDLETFRHSNTNCETMTEGELIRTRSKCRR